MSQFMYTGDQSNLSEPYMPSPELQEAVNVAIQLKRPLLLKGEPGCGKTRLAKAVAEELKLAYYPWSVKSTSRARDGLYIYDTIGRLRDAQLAANQNLVTPEALAKFRDPNTYVNWGPLGKAFRGDERAVVLIDEIDKADIDFPNDLLLELDQNEFTVEELPTNNTFEAKYPPIIFITSNDEKELPDAFLRRCLFFYIDFPKRDTLRKIVSRHVSLDLDDPLLSKAVDLFWDLRQRMEAEKQHGGKKVSTSELINWVEILKLSNTNPENIDLNGALLFPSVLLKSREDHDRYKTIS